MVVYLVKHQCLFVFYILSLLCGVPVRNPYHIADWHAKKQIKLKKCHKKSKFTQFYWNIHAIKFRNKVTDVGLNTFWNAPKCFIIFFFIIYKYARKSLKWLQVILKFKYLKYLRSRADMSSLWLTLGWYMKNTRLISSAKACVQSQFFTYIYMSYCPRICLKYDHELLLHSKKFYIW